MRAVLVGALLFAAACGSRPAPTQPVSHPPIGAGSATVSTVAPHPAVSNGSGVGSAAPAKLLPLVAAIGCPSPTCAFHAGAAGYFTCLAGGAGSCFHFGAPCTPTDNCMFDPAARAYKQCGHAVEGMCEKWGGACTPASGCMFDPRDGLHRHCDDASAGGCQKYGALCAP